MPTASRLLIPRKRLQLTACLFRRPPKAPLTGRRRSFDPETGLLYVGTAESFSMFYLTDTDPHPEGYGAAERGVGSYGGSLRAIDYKTGKTVWNHRYPSGGGDTGILTTAGKLLFAGDGAQHLLAFD